MNARPLDVWLIPLRQPPDVILRLAELLPAEEHTRAERFLFARDRESFTVAHAALRQILGAALDLHPSRLLFEHSAHGKPSLASTPLHFNLTHAGDFALLAVGPHPVGIDLEPIRELPDFLDVARQFAPAERACLLAAPDLSLAFFQCWTRKEAFVKALGSGLSTPLDSFEVTFHPDPVPRLTTGGAPVSAWRLHDLALPIPYAAALVTHPETPPATLRHWRPDAF